MTGNDFTVRKFEVQDIPHVQALEKTHYPVPLPRSEWIRNISNVQVSSIVYESCDGTIESFVIAERHTKGTGKDKKVFFKITRMGIEDPTDTKVFQRLTEALVSDIMRDNPEWVYATVSQRDFVTAKILTDTGYELSETTQNNYVFRLNVPLELACRYFGGTDLLNKEVEGN